MTPVAAVANPALKHPSAHSGSSPAELTADFIAGLHRDFHAAPANTVAQNAVTQCPVDDVALNRQVVTTTDFTFSHLLDDWAVTHQKKSGRCWMFAGLNLFRVHAMKAMNLKDFEFSQSFTLFWDKFERSNHFLEAIIETSGRDVDDRTVAFLLDRPLEDGGQWNMFVNIIKKHGLVPKAAMPETQSSSDTMRMNSLVIHKLREAARSLRELRQRGAPMEALRAHKTEVLRVVHRMLCIHLGTPPTSFDWQWNDKDRKFHRDGEMTPQEFAKKYIGLDLDDYVCLVHDPRPSSPVNRTFTVDFLGNVVGGDRVIYLNVDIDVMKSIAMKTITGGEPVWFGCDVGKMMRRDLGLWDANLFDFDALYDTTFRLTKAERLQYHQTLMTHAMLFTGVDVVDDSPRRWRVENSWGEEGNGRKGFFTMNDSWFDEHMFEIAANRKHLPKELLGALNQEPIVLPAWDPMARWRCKQPIGMNPTPVDIERALRNLRRLALPFEGDSETIEVGDALVGFNPAVDTPFPSNNPNRVRFAGCDTPLASDHLDRILAAYRDRGISHFFFWAGPTIDVSPLENRLIERGGRPFMHVEYPVFMLAGVANASNAKSTLTARAVSADELRSLAEAIHQIQSEAKHARQFMAYVESSLRTDGTPSFLPVLAFDGDTPVGSSLLTINGPWAYLGWAAVRPDARGCGGQRVMIAERLRLAAQHGCRWCASETVNFVPYSIGNLLAMGFVERYQPRVFEFGGEVRG